MKPKLWKAVRPVISLVLVFVILIGIVAIPAEAVPVSTSARIYSNITASPAYKKFPEFAGLYVPEYSVPVPGMEFTDVKGTTCTTMVPQGVCVTEDYMILSAYDFKGKCNSVLYVLSNDQPQNRKYLMTVVLPTRAKVGGIAFDGTYLWVCSGNGISAIDYSVFVNMVDAAVASKKDSVSTDFYSTLKTAVKASFITYSDGLLWVGEYKDKGDTTGKLYAYAVSHGGQKLVQKYCISLPDRTRGVCFKDGNLILSRSYGRNLLHSDYLSELSIYQIYQPDSNGNIKKSNPVKTIMLPPMVAGISAGDTYLYSVYESSATCYYKGTDGKGKCKYPVDRVVAFALSDLVEASGSGDSNPIETIYFPACDVKEISFSNALSTLNYDCSLTTRRKIACANGFVSYTGTADQNDTLLSLMKAGKLINPGIRVSVDAPSVVTLDMNTATISIGGTTQIVANYPQGSISWKSTNSTVATVSVMDDHTVSVKGVKAGKATIICSLSNGSVAKCVVTVVTDYFDPCGADEVSLVNALSEQGFDVNMDTRVKIAPANGIAGYTGTAQQDQALLLLMKAGKLINPGLARRTDIPAKVTLNITGAAMSVGENMTLNASFTDGGVTWKSSNTKVLTIKIVDSHTATLSAVGTGKATITCTLSNGSFAKCVVTVQYLYFEKCSDTQESIVNALKAQNFDSSFETRTIIAQANGITNYQGTAAQNEKLLDLMVAGKLINPGLKEIGSGDSTGSGEDASGEYFGRCDSGYESIVKALESIGVDGSFTYREQIAKANGITDYSGTADQNILMLDLLKAGKLRKPSVELEEDQYYVCFNANGGTGTMAEIIWTADTALPKNTFTYKGYIFEGWSTSASGSVMYVDQAQISLSASVTLYAVWRPIQYTVTYNANGGQGSMPNTVVTYGVHTILATPGFTREGYSLTGWYRYRTSDDKWYYESSDGATHAWYVAGTEPSGYRKDVMKTTSGVSKTSALDGDVIIMYAVWTKGENASSLDGKKVMFIGNSFIYYGGVVEYGSQKKTDKGWFYQICKANGEDVTVIDCTYGGHHLYDFTSKGCKSGSCHSGKDLLSGIDLKTIDYVFISESGNNNSNFVRDVKAIMKRFPSDTKFFYLSHSYSYIKNHKNIINNLSAIEKLGVGIIEWGKLVDDVIDGRTKVSGATVTYKKTSFIKNKGDTHHPNPLAGYIAAQMAYCAITGKTAVGQMPDVYNIGKSVKFGKGSVGYTAFTSTHYKSSSSSNYKTILKSKSDIAGLQKLMDKYLGKWDLGINGQT